MLKQPNYVYGASDLVIPAHINMGQYMIDNIRKYKDDVALINGITDERMTFKQIGEHSMKLSLALVKLGLKKGDTVAICSENRLEFSCTTIAVLCSGATVTPFNVMYTGGEIKHALSISKPSYLFCSPFVYQMHEKTIKSVPHFKKIIIYGDKKPANVLLYNDLIASVKDFHPEQFRAVDVNGQTDTAFIMYSSGTTGLPKGVIVTHLNSLASCIVSNIDKKGDITNLSIAPWTHAMGLMGTMGTLAFGKLCIFLNKFDPTHYLNTIEKYKVSNLTLVPPVLLALCKTPSKADVTSVTTVYSGAAPLKKDIFGAVLQKFPNITTVLQAYGMTETTLAVTKDNGESPEPKPGSIGPVVPGCIIKVVDVETNKPVGPNTPGELCISGPVISPGYVGMSRKGFFDEEGFLKTGDIGYYDDDGYFYIVDRLKELIKYKGFQVPPAEIEAALVQNEKIRDAGVIGLPKGSVGEVPLAFVVKQPGVELTEQEVKDYIAEKLSNPKHLRGGVRFVEEIPKNPSGKILRRVLRDYLKSGKSKL